jgi:hypothetical protein
VIKSLVEGCWNVKELGENKKSAFRKSGFIEFE